MTTSAVASLRRLPGWRLVPIVGAAICLLLILLEASFFLRPGAVDVLLGLAHHIFVLALLLVVTVGTRTVSVASLGLFWLIGVFPVVFLAMTLQWLPAELLGTDSASPVSTLVVPILDVVVYLVPVVAYYAFMSRRNLLQPAATDGLLIGFAVGAGYALYEDGVIGEIMLSGDGWLGAIPWSLFAPTISPVGGNIALNHALWAALCGLSVGLAVMLRHRRYAWMLALIGPILAAMNHGLVNVLSNDPFLGVGRGSMPLVPAILNVLTLSGVLPLLVVAIGAIGVALLERRILASVSANWPMFPRVPLGAPIRLLWRARTSAALRLYLATSRYERFRRLVMYAAWRAAETRTAASAAGAMLRPLNRMADEAGLSSRPGATALAPEAGTPAP